MRILLFILCLFLPAFSWADEVYKDSVGEVRLAQGPCNVAGVLRWLPEKERPEYQIGSGRFEGKAYFLCWRKQGNVVHVQWEDGDGGILFEHQFKSDPGA